MNKRTNCLEYREKCGLWPHHPISGGGLDNGKVGHLLESVTGEDPGGGTMQLVLESHILTGEMVPGGEQDKGRDLYLE